MLQKFILEIFTVDCYLLWTVYPHGHERGGVELMANSRYMIDDMLIMGGEYGDTIVVKTLDKFESFDLYSLVHGNSQPNGASGVIAQLTSLLSEGNCELIINIDD